MSEKSVNKVLKAIEEATKNLPKNVALEIDIRPIRAYDPTPPEGSEVVLRCKRCRIGGIAFATAKLYEEMRAAFPDGWICNNCGNVNRWP